MKVFSNYSELISGYMTAKPSLKFFINNLPPFCLYLKSREFIYHLNRYHVTNRMVLIAASWHKVWRRYDAFSKEVCL